MHSLPSVAALLLFGLAGVAGLGGGAPNCTAMTKAANENCGVFGEKSGPCQSARLHQTAKCGGGVNASTASTESSPAERTEGAKEVSSEGAAMKLAAKRGELLQTIAMANDLYDHAKKHCKCAAVTELAAVTTGNVTKNVTLMTVVQLQGKIEEMVLQAHPEMVAGNTTEKEPPKTPDKCVTCATAFRDSKGCAFTARGQDSLSNVPDPCLDCEEEFDVECQAVPEDVQMKYGMPGMPMCPQQAAKFGKDPPPFGVFGGKEAFKDYLTHDNGKPALTTYSPTPVPTAPTAAPTNATNSSEIALGNASAAGETPAQAVMREAAQANAPASRKLLAEMAPEKAAALAEQQVELNTQPGTSDIVKTDVEAAKAEIKAAEVAVPGVTPPAPPVKIVVTAVPTPAAPTPLPTIPFDPLDTNKDGLIDEQEHAKSSRAFSAETHSSLINAAKTIGAEITAAMKEEKAKLAKETEGSDAGPAAPKPPAPRTFYIATAKGGVNCEDFNKDEFKATMTGKFDAMIKAQTPKKEVVNETEVNANNTRRCATCGASFEAAGGCSVLDQGKAIDDLLPAACIGCATDAMVDSCAQKKIAEKKEREEMPTAGSVKTLTKEESTGRVDAKVAATLPAAAQQELSKEIKKEETGGKADKPAVDKVLDKQGKEKVITEMGGSIKEIEGRIDYKEKNGADTDTEKEPEQRVPKMPKRDP